MPISQQAKTFITTIIAIGGILVMHAIAVWSGQPLLPAAYLVVAVLASTLKVRLPGIPGTFSANCLVTVLGIAQLNVPDLVFVAITCAVVQSLWRPKKPPTRQQVLFNGGVFAISAALSGWTFSGLTTLFPAIPTASLVIAAAVFFLVNTGAVSVGVALIEDAPVLRVWRKWHFWALPYYFINVSVAVLIVSISTASMLVVLGLFVTIVPLTFAIYKWFVRMAALLARTAEISA